jgi:hypothetical protein
VWNEAFLHSYCHITRFHADAAALDDRTAEHHEAAGQVVLAMVASGGSEVVERNTTSRVPVNGDRAVRRLHTRSFTPVRPSR